MPRPSDDNDRAEAAASANARGTGTLWTNLANQTVQGPTPRVTRAKVRQGANARAGTKTNPDAGANARGTAKPETNLANQLMPISMREH